MRRWRGRAVAIFVAFFLIVPLAVSASAAGPVITGVISDTLGLSIAGAIVSDGLRSTTSASDGRYSFTETSPSTYTITASKAGFVTRSIQVDTLLNIKDQNLTLPFIINATLSGRYISTAKSGITLTETVTSTAPDPGATSCAFSLDNATGTTSPMVYQSSVGNTSTWTWSKSLPLASTEGNFALNAWIERCSDHTHLDLAVTKSYVIDNTPPTLDASTLFPASFGNTRYLSQPLGLKVIDAGPSRIGQGGVSFQLTDLSNGVTSTVAGTYHSDSGWAITSAVALTLNHEYKTSVTTVDNAGNSSTFSQDSAWLVMDVSQMTSAFNLHPTVGIIDKTKLNSDGTYTATFPNVGLDNGGGSITVSGSEHAGSGKVNYVVPILSGSQVCSTVQGVDACTDVNPGGDSAWGDRSTSNRFDVAKSFFLQTATVSSGSTNVGTLTAHVLPTWTNVILRSMTAQTVAGKLATCDSPLSSNASNGCTPDPIATGKLNVVLPTGSVLTTSPYTYQVVDNLATTTVIFEELDASSL
ncbi:MAG: carboxypeptidase regulatory-like domain-containing protein, partial [Actinobacteria bacterium]|nr:carboxypeptidase regulatory-like domain-containing protein [Actinomycetota bacterium]